MGIVNIVYEIYHVHKSIDEVANINIGKFLLGLLLYIIEWRQAWYSVGLHKC